MLLESWHGRKGSSAADIGLREQLMNFSSRRFVRVGAVLLGAALTFGAGAFFGYQSGWAKMDVFCGSVIQGSHAGSRVSLLALHNKAIDALRNGDTATTEGVLRFLAMSDAARIRECALSDTCRRVMVQSPPENSVLEGAISAGKKLRPDLHVCN